MPRKRKWLIAGLAVGGLLILLVCVDSLAVYAESQTHPDAWSELPALPDRDAVLAWYAAGDPAQLGRHRDMVDVKGYDLFTIQRRRGHSQLQVYYDDHDQVTDVYRSYTGRSLGVFNSNDKLR